MQLFVMLLLICLIGGFVVTSLIWFLFWATGIFECPKQLRAFLGIPSTPRQRVEASAPVRLTVTFHAQIGRSNLGLTQIGSSPFGSVHGASAMRPILTESSNLQNAGHYVASRY
jgi:hypothetical protein